MGARVLLAVLGVAALAMPLPSLSGLPAVLAVIALPLPLLVARWPGSAWVTWLLVVSLVEWTSTALVAGAAPPGLTVAYGCLLYLLHTTAAFAASLPTTRRVEPAVLGRLLLRLAGVLAVAVPLMLAAVLAPARPGSTLLGLAGVLAALGVGVVLVGLVHRRSLP